MASWIGSILPLAALVGGVAGGPLLEAFGRKITILATGMSEKKLEYYIVLTYFFCFQFQLYLHLVI